MILLIDTKRSCPECGEEIWGPLGMSGRVFCGFCGRSGMPLSSHRVTYKLESFDGAHWLISWKAAHGVGIVELAHQIPAGQH